MENIKEKWKTLIYQGNTYNQFKVSNYGGLKNTKAGHIYKLIQNKSTGYIGVCVSLGNRDDKKYIRIHRAVAETFIPNPDNLPEVNHITGDKTKNEVWNLEWCTRKDYQIHAVKTGLQKFDTISGINNYGAKLSEDDIMWIRNHYIPRDKQFGCRALGRKFGVSHTQISRLITGMTYRDV